MKGGEGVQEFEEIYAEYYLRVYRYLLDLCRNPSLAEEITQEAFFKAYKGIGSFKGDCKISSWLCEIAKNSYFSHLKREKNRRKFQPQDAPAGEIEARMLDSEAAMGIHKALHGLKEPYREVFWLKTFGELGFRQISELFGKTESWARVTYYRAKIMIREELE